MGDLMKKHEMTEEDIKLQFITPAIEGAGWDRQKQIRMEYNFTDGRVIVRGNVTARGKRKRTDYLLYQRFCPCLIRTVISTLAGIAAHGTHHAIGVARFGHEYGQVVVLFNQWKQHRTSPHQLEQVEYCKAKRNQRCKRNFADDDNIRLALLAVSPAPNCLRFGCA